MPENQSNVFRKETLDRISSPEQLTCYLRVTNPGIWVVLAAVILLLVGIFAWAAVGTLETSTEAVVIIENHRAEVAADDAEALTAGMPVRVAGQEAVILTAGDDEYGRSVGIAEFDLPDGIYEGRVVLEQIHPLDFLLTSR